MSTTQTTPNTNEEPLVTKMSVKGIGCKPTGGLPADDTKPNPMCLIMGKASGIKMGEGGDGRMWTALTGTFRGVNLTTGKAFRSGKLFLPAGIQDVVEGAVKQLPVDGGAVKFAMRIESIKATNPIGYSYQAVNLMPIEAENDELADLIAAVNGGPAPAQIEAPAKEAPKSGKK
jgi:hypothetical protein